MRFKVFSGSGVLLGEIENATSFSWTRRYRSPGGFRAQLVLSEENVRLTDVGNLVWFRGAPEYCIIETRVTTYSPKEQKIEITGRDALGLLDRRRLIADYNATEGQTVRKAMKDIMTDGYVTAIDGLTWRDNADVTGTFSEDTGYSFGTSVLDVAQECAGEGDCGLRAITGFASGGSVDAVAELYNGVDRSTAQSENRRVVFSERYGDIDRIEYTKSSANYVNTVVVSGKWEDVDTGRVFKYIEIVYENDTEPPEAARVETHIACSFNGDSWAMTSDRYKTYMRAEGRAQLGISHVIESVEVDVLDTAQHVYQQDYDVGDIVTVEIPSLGIELDKRVMEVEQVFESDTVRIIPTFGEPLPSRIRFRRRM